MIVFSFERGSLLQKPFVHMDYFITTKEKRGEHTSDKRKKGESIIE
jgi:hypothetical protein